MHIFVNCILDSKCQCIKRTDLFSYFIWVEWQMQLFTHPQFYEKNLPDVPLRRVCPLSQTFVTAESPMSTTLVCWIAFFLSLIGLSIHDWLSHPVAATIPNRLNTIFYDFVFSCSAHLTHIKHEKTSLPLVWIEKKKISFHIIAINLQLECRDLNERWSANL